MESSDGKKKRRSKADSDGRVYNCECGKSYFSYQALYTHKKTKHSDSITPEDIPKKKRGRPKLNKSPRNETQEEEVIQIQDPIQEKMNSISRNPQSSTCDDVFAKYLIVKRETEPFESFIDYKASIYSLRNCINKNSEKVDANNFFSDEGYTSIEKPNLLPNICNFYIMNYLPKERPDHDKKKEVSFMLDFCQWLNDNDYTDLEIAVSNN